MHREKNGVFEIETSPIWQSPVAIFQTRVIYGKIEIIKKKYLTV